MVRTSLVSLSLVSMTALAGAQGADAPPPPADPAATPTDPAAVGAPVEPAAAPAPDPNAMAVAPAPPPVAPATGTRLRNGFSLSVGQEFGTTNLGTEVSGQLYGLDWRIGAQISDAIGVYLHSHLSLGTAGVGNTSGYTGNFATALTGEYTLPMRLFLGAGAGYGVLNNPSGPLVQFRVGYYPFEKEGAGKARRLNIALDSRLYFVEAGAESITMKHFAISLGYDRF